MSNFAHLVVDTLAFIKNAQLQEVAENCYTVQGVLDEIKNDRQLKRLVVLPYSLQVWEPDSPVLAKVTNFAKKTGDFASLSLDDLKILALTYQLEKEHLGTEHLRKKPKAAQTICSAQKPQELIGTGKVYGFYDGKKRSGKETEPNVQSEEESLGMEVEVRDETSELKDKFAELSTEEAQELEETLLKKIEISEAEMKEDSDEQCEEEKFSEEGSEEDEDDDDDDDEGWITPSNIKEVKRDYGTDLLEENTSPVACMTTDFAKQNVLKQIGLHIPA